MRHLIAIFLLVVYTCTGTTLQQLQKAPVLLEHYREHQAIVTDVSVMDFLVLHYLSGNVKDADYDRDMQLPFKATDFVASASTVAFMPAFYPELIFTPPLLAQVHGIALDEDFTPSRYLSGIWQPPQTS
ncbi:hypothetical protein [Pontibacter ruber]|uniref:Uncharacterized protein n=1 Tax=Pontibacter ruber TaxID=1343895 RepID=A0ABW5D148_9BACT|nr:hypothetical protein [Pontibacter ruber]